MRGEKLSKKIKETEKSDAQDYLNIHVIQG
jgi:hypothetical protein